MQLDDKKTIYSIEEGWLNTDVKPKKRKKGKCKKDKEPMGFYPRKQKGNGTNTPRLIRRG